MANSTQPIAANASRRHAVLEPAQSRQFSATLPLIALIRIDPGSGGIEQSVLFDAASSILCAIAPGSARSVRLRASTSRILFICARHSTRLVVGTLPPLNPAPELASNIGTRPNSAQPHALRHLRGSARKQATASGRR